MSLLEELTTVVGRDGVLVGDDVKSRAIHIWNPRPVEALAIVRPKTTTELSEILKRCHAIGQPVVAQGGRTGLVESHWSKGHELVISLERMNRIEEIDRVDRTAVVQAGVVLEALQQAAEQQGLMYPLDLGGRGSCTVGGNIATNAGGNRVIRYGMARDSVLGLEAVLADGTVVSSMNRMIKNNAGYDLKHWFIGTEGTLGIVTRAVLRLREKPRSQETAFVALKDFASVTALLKRADLVLGGMLSAFEVMWNDFYQLVTTAPAKQSPPLAHDYPYYVLIEAMGGDPTSDRQRLESLLSECMEAEIIVDAVLAETEAQRRNLWAMRDDVGQTSRHGPTFAFDVSLRLSAMEDYVAKVKANMAAAFAKHHLFTFGHLGDGNIHFVASVFDRSQAAHRKVEQAIYEPLRAIGGSVSAEHGVGLEKKPYLSWCRSDAEIAAMRVMKRALDPMNILNPGKIFDA